MAQKQFHRGPDDLSCIEIETEQLYCLLVFHRLEIMDPQGGRQPFNIQSTFCIANGEIYNFKFLQKKYNFSTKSQSDCEVIPWLYNLKGCNFVSELDGCFAFILLDVVNQKVVVARDHMGIIPLYWARSNTGGLFFSSEMKCLVNLGKIDLFPPRTIWEITAQNLLQKSWFSPQWNTVLASKGGFALRRRADLLLQTKQLFTNAVRKRINCDVPWGCLLSGGLDSSLVTTIAAKAVEPKQIHTFTIGLRNSPDFKYAREVSTWCNSIHHEIVFTIQEGIDVIPEVIRHLETFDVTTVRASTPQYLLAKKIKSMGIKMVLSGEGADESWAGYLYFHQAPNAKALAEETIEKLNKLHFYDCLRTNKSMMASGIETRVPFLDQKFLAFCMETLPTEFKLPSAFRNPNGKNMEKGVLRTAFKGVLPPSVLWRRKEQFSDSVGSCWIEGIQAYVQETKEYLKGIYPSSSSLEEAWYREIFDSFLYEKKTVPLEKSIACSTSKALQWIQNPQVPVDPSAKHLFQQLNQRKGI